MNDRPEYKQESPFKKIQKQVGGMIPAFANWLSSGKNSNDSSSSSPDPVVLTHTTIEKEPHYFDGQETAVLVQDLIREVNAIKIALTIKKLNLDISEDQKWNDLLESDGSFNINAFRELPPHEQMSFAKSLGSKFNQEIGNDLFGLKTASRNQELFRETNALGTLSHAIGNLNKFVGGGTGTSSDKLIEAGKKYIEKELKCFDQDQVSIIRTTFEQKILSFTKLKADSPDFKIQDTRGVNDRLKKKGAELRGLAVGVATTAGTIFGGASLAGLQLARGLQGFATLKFNREGERLELAKDIKAEIEEKKLSFLSLWATYIIPNLKRFSKPELQKVLRYAYYFQNLGYLQQGAVDYIINQKKTASNNSEKSSPDLKQSNENHVLPKLEAFYKEISSIISDKEGKFASNESYRAELKERFMISPAIKVGDLVISNQQKIIGVSALQALTGGLKLAHELFSNSPIQGIIEHFNPESSPIEVRIDSLKSYLDWDMTNPNALRTSIANDLLRNSGYTFEDEEFVQIVNGLTEKIWEAKEAGKGLTQKEMTEIFSGITDAKEKPYPIQEIWTEILTGNNENPEAIKDYVRKKVGNWQPSTGSLLDKGTEEFNKQLNAMMKNADELDITLKPQPPIVGGALVTFVGLLGVSAWQLKPQLRKLRQSKSPQPTEVVDTEQDQQAGSLPTEGKIDSTDHTNGDLHNSQNNKNLESNRTTYNTTDAVTESPQSTEVVDTEQNNEYPIPEGVTNQIESGEFDEGWRYYSHDSQNFIEVYLDTNPDEFILKEANYGGFYGYLKGDRLYVIPKPDQPLTTPYVNNHGFRGLFNADYPRLVGKGNVKYGNNNTFSYPIPAVLKKKSSDQWVLVQKGSIS